MWGGTGFSGAGTWMKLAHLNIPAALVLLAALGAGAEPLVSVRSSALPPVPDSIVRVVSVDARPLAFGLHGVWVLQGDRSRWTPVDWHPAGEVLGAASDGRVAFLFLGARHDGPVERIERIVLAEGG